MCVTFDSIYICCGFDFTEKLDYTWFPVRQSAKDTFTIRIYNIFAKLGSLKPSLFSH